MIMRTNEPSTNIEFSPTNNSIPGLTAALLTLTTFVIAAATLALTFG